MIQGVFALNKNRSLISVSIENNGVRHEIDLPNSASSKLSQYFAQEHQYSFLQGHSASRSVFCSHFNCIGESCTCRSVLQDFLSSEKQTKLDELVKEKEDQLKNELKFPFLIVLVQGTKSIFVDCFGPQDFQTRIVVASSNIFIIRDCIIFSIPKKTTNSTEEIITTCTPEAQLCNLVDHWLQGRAEPCDVASGLTVILAAFFKGLPKPVGLNNTLFSFAEGEALFVFNNFNSIVKKVRGPKGKVSAFNFFSQKYHQNMKDNCDGKDGTNERNGLIGKIWSQMSKEEKEPFENLAKKDEERFEKEKESFCSNNKNSPSPTKLSSYNLFAQQEIQFLKAVGCGNLLGEHAGHRWKSERTDKGEKELYISLSQFFNSTGSNKETPETSGSSRIVKPRLVSEDDSTI